MRILLDIDVPDLQAAIDFYCAAFGLRHSRTLDGDVAELVGASSVIYLLLKAEGSSAARSPSLPRSYSRHWTPVHLDFVVDDLAAATARALAAGARQEGDGEEWRGSRFVTFADPFGHGFCLIEFTGETYLDV